MPEVLVFASAASRMRILGVRCGSPDGLPPGEKGNLSTRCRVLGYRRAVGIGDTGARQLLTSVLPAIAQPEHAHPLFLDHVVLAMASHVANVYGGVAPGQGRRRGGLSFWQMKRVTEMMSECLADGPALSQLAEACGLSTGHFARAFRQTSTAQRGHRENSR